MFSKKERSKIIGYKSIAMFPSSWVAYRAAQKKLRDNYIV